MEVARKNMLCFRKLASKADRFGGNKADMYKKMLLIMWGLRGNVGVYALIKLSHP